MSTKAVGRSKVISQYEEGRLSRKETSLALGVSERQITRIVRKYREKRLLGIEHGNAGKLSPKRIPNEIRNRIRVLAQEKYLNFNYQHLQEIIAREEQIEVSYSSLKRICASMGITKRQRRRKKMRKHRKRYSSAGLMLQMDGSEHPWVNGKSWVLIVLN